MLNNSEVTGNTNKVRASFCSSKVTNDILVLCNKKLSLVTYLFISKLLWMQGYSTFFDVKQSPYTMMYCYHILFIYQYTGSKEFAC